MNIRYKLGRWLLKPVTEEILHIFLEKQERYKDTDPRRASDCGYIALGASWVGYYWPGKQQGNVYIPQEPSDEDREYGLK